jgi:ribonuclease-3
MPPERVAAVTPEREAQLHGLEERLGHHFADLSLLDRALTHTSHAHEDASGASRHSEPLEFLGDAILGFLVADLLHRRDPDSDEGTKSKVRARLVSAPSLARRAAEIGLPDLLLLGRGEEKMGGRANAALWADAYEATIAGLYLDGGIETAQSFVNAEFAPELAALQDAPDVDHKSALQEVLQAQGEPVPEYVVVAEDGAGRRTRFLVRCVARGRTVSEGEGYSKKEAQQDAARKALEVIRGQGPE